ncbi:MAG: RNA polymerase sigma factor [Lachnospiraceae bacterium]|jgi:RNA polymerase sigma-70 factor (ECF subfamily)|nr:RNA polymerase sigma factor [Lachnospiraceae bacterium]
MTVEEVVEKYSNILFRICMVILCNHHDAQDALQDTFCRYMEKQPVFSEAEHEKAWLIKVATNICRDMRRFQLRHPKVDLEELTDYCAAPAQREILAEVMALPVGLKTVIILYYVEGYGTVEIADTLNLSVSAVKKRLQRGRELLKKYIGEEEVISI